MISIRIKTLPILILSFITCAVLAQQGGITWSPYHDAYYTEEQSNLVQYTLPGGERSIILSRADLTPKGKQDPLPVTRFHFSSDEQKILIYTNTKRVWRINTRGDYWVFNRKDKSLEKVGASLPSSSLMFAKFSPDGTKVAYLCNYNLYMENLDNHKITQLTRDGTRKFINGTFDWVYEEEFSCRDGFRWSPDGRSLAFWQLDASTTRDFYLINNTDSIYSKVIPVEYPKVGQPPSRSRIGVIDINTSKITWMNIQGDPQQHYLVRLEFIPGTNDFLVQQLNRKQNESKLIRCNSLTGKASVIYSDRDDAWIDVLVPEEDSYAVDFKHTINWIAGGKEFLWSSEKDGWRHIYRIRSDGKGEALITKGDFDVILPKLIDEKRGYVYFMASPSNATQQYLYRAPLTGIGSVELVTPAGLSGTHDYYFAPTGNFALHIFSNSYTRPVGELIGLPQHNPLDAGYNIQANLSRVTEKKSTEFFTIKTADGVEMDGWMVKPEPFDPGKKYPVLFYVYSEPWEATVKDVYGISARTFNYAGDMRKDGYVYISIDNRGTPAPKGRAWRKAIYRKIGVVNVRDQAMAAMEVLKWPFIDSSRVAVWGWSGGANATLNLLFQYPGVYKTGIAVSAVTNQLTYDNIYQERFMGLPDENPDDFINGSPLTYARYLEGNLLYIHGTGDDNVHYQNAELLLNELIKYNKQFQFMAYPNRTHGISEGEGTSLHLSTLYTNYLKAHCPPGGR
jgi:dipeptidyl-peptidase-4